MTPLSAAVIGLKSDNVKILVAAGTTLDLTSGDGVTALMRAAKLGDIESVRIVVAAGANPDLQDLLLGWSALHYAAANGHESVYKALLSTGVNPDLQDQQGRTAERLLKVGMNLQ